MFNPVTRERGSEQVAEQIRQLIADGALKPGERLPAERELASEFGVSRSTLREAVQRLETMGLVEVRQGIGTIVSARATTAQDPSFWLPWLSAHRDDVLALLEVREALERKAAALAAETVAAGRPETEAILDRLARSLDEMDAAAERQDISTLVRLDLEFHADLAAAAGNNYLMNLAGSVNHVFSDRRAVLAMPGQAKQSADEHRRILTAVRAARPAEAEAAMTAHLARAIAAVRRSVAGEPAGGPGAR